MSHLPNESETGAAVVRSSRGSHTRHLGSTLPQLPGTGLTAAWCGCGLMMARPIQRCCVCLTSQTRPRCHPCWPRRGRMSLSSLRRVGAVWELTCG